MDPITLGIITAAVGAVVTVAAKRWVFPFFENCFKHIKNFFSGTKSENHSSIEKEKTEEETPKEETEEDDETKSIATNEKVIKHLEDDIDLEIDNNDIKPHSNTDISVERTAQQEHAGIDKATDKLIEIKNKMHNPHSTHTTPEHHYHNHKIVGMHTDDIVRKEDRIHGYTNHENFMNNKKDDESER